jgi:ABC-type glycerol-3-phosphate transport system substrate-binding protein
MKNRIRWYLLILGMILLAGPGCSNLPLISTATPTNSPPILTTPTPTRAPTPVVPDEPTSSTLTVWVPPQFAPSQENPVGILLQDRLDSFSQLYSNLQINVRIKSETGPASLLESLYATSGVAPLVLPDLVLLSTEDMYTAAEQNLIYPYPPGYPSEDDTDWYNIASALSSYQDERYLLPLAADAMVMVYNPELVESAPRTWDDLLSAGNIISFPATDPQATFTIALYLSNGGTFRDSEENIALQSAPLASVLNTYQQAHAANILPPNPTQIESDESAWIKFNETNKQILITWASRFFGQADETLTATSLPTLTGQPFTLIKGWGWVLATPDPNKQAAATELAKYLTEAEFAGPWTQASYLLPLRPFALSYWEDEPAQILASQLLPQSTQMPSPDVLSLVSTPITDAVLDVLTAVLSPEEAAQIAVDSLED